MAIAKWGYDRGKTGKKGIFLDGLKGEDPSCCEPCYCNRWVLWLFQQCLSGAGNADASASNNGDVVTPTSPHHPTSSDTYTVPGYFFVDLSSTPVPVVNPPPQSVSWLFQWEEARRSATIPGLTTTGFVVVDTVNCTMPNYVDPYGTYCGYDLMEPSGSPGVDTACRPLTPISVGPAICDSFGIFQETPSGGGFNSHCYVDGVGLPKPVVSLLAFYQKVPNFLCNKDEATIIAELWPF